MSIERLKNLCLVRISGDDAFSFLQGQLTNDLKQLDESPVWQLTGYCNPKGRLLALFYIWKADNCYYAILESELREVTIKRLQMYVMRSKVTIEHIEPAIICGAQSPAQLIAANIVSRKRHNAHHGALEELKNSWILYVNQRALYIELAESGLNLSSSTNASAGESWLSADIKEGIPTITVSSTEQFIPQMLNLDLMDAINFKKGCYTGQEIIARMHYLGNVKQRMFCCDIAVTAEELSRAGDKILIAAEDSKSVGKVVSINADANMALVILRIDSLNKPLMTEHGNSIKVRNQKFSYQQH